MKKKFYIASAIVYATEKPHIGNTYEIVLADAIARYQRLKGNEVYFQTGSDEHGEKIALKACDNGLATQDYVDGVVDQIKNIFNIMNIKYDKFVRTTDNHHKLIVQKIFDKLYQKDDIYLGNYEGLYCIPCESFWTESQLVDKKCPDCGREVIVKQEEAYFFRLSKYQDWLVKYYEDHPDFIEPLSRKNEMMKNFINPGLQDLCVSRTSFDWGIKVPFNDKHVIYVWLDALSNYITNIGYDPDGSSEEFNSIWPCDLHLVGKDIIRFHVIYWPIFLEALGLSQPKRIFGHPWLLCDNEKMSKSKGNQIYAEDLVNEFGLDAIRYYILHEIPFANDGSITYDLIIDRINSDLANILGNLVNRTLSMAKTYFNGKIVNKLDKESIDDCLIENINNLAKRIDEKMEHLEIGSAIDEIFKILKYCNKYIDETTPWILAKDEKKKDRLETILYNILEGIRVCALFLCPYIPDTSEHLLKQLNIKDTSFNYNKLNEYQINEINILFQRIDKEKKLKELL